MATSSRDGCVRLFDWFSGDCLARVKGHSSVRLRFSSSLLSFLLYLIHSSLHIVLLLLLLLQMVTGVRFSLDGRYLFSVSADGCIFVWRLAPALTRSIQSRLIEMKMQCPSFPLPSRVEVRALPLPSSNPI